LILQINRKSVKQGTHIPIETKPVWDRSNMFLLSIGERIVNARTWPLRLIWTGIKAHRCHLPPWTSAVGGWQNEHSFLEIGF